MVSSCTSWVYQEGRLQGQNNTASVALLSTELTISQSTKEQKKANFEVKKFKLLIEQLAH